MLFVFQWVKYYNLQFHKKRFLIRANSSWN